MLIIQVNVGVACMENRLTANWVFPTIARTNASISASLTRNTVQEKITPMQFIDLQVSDQRPVPRKPRKLFGPVKPFSVYLYLKMGGCIRLKLLA